MKQVILGLVGAAVVIYTVISCLSIYSISGRKNEMENCLSRVLEQNMEEYYVRMVPKWVRKELPEEPEDETDAGSKAHGEGGTDGEGTGAAAESEAEIEGGKGDRENIQEGENNAGAGSEDGIAEPGKRTVQWEIVYVPLRKCSDVQVEAFVKQDIISQLGSDSRITVSVIACDMEKGILSAKITETFYLPSGKAKTIQCVKTLIVE